MKQFFGLAMLSLALLISLNLSFADTDNLLFEELEMEKYSEDYSRIFCMMASMYDYSLESCESLPGAAQPQYTGLSNVEVLEKFFQSTYENSKLLEEQPIFDINDISLPEEQMIQKFKQDMIMMNNIIHELSSGISELEYRGFEFKPVKFFDDNCNLIDDLVILEPELQLPKHTASEFEIYKWIADYDEILDQYILLLRWQVGGDFENVMSEDDKLILSEYLTAIEKLDETVTKLNEKRTAINLQVVRSALNDIEEVPEKYESEWIHSIVDFDEESFEILIQTSLEQENFYEYQDSGCLETSTIQVFDNDSQLPQIEETQMEHSLQFVEYKVNSFPSPRIQFEYGVSAENVSCNEGYESLMRPNLESSVCVKHNTTEKLLERGWIEPPLI